MKLGVRGIPKIVSCIIFLSYFPFFLSLFQERLWSLLPATEARISPLSFSRTIESEKSSTKCLGKQRFFCSLSFSSYLPCFSARTTSRRSQRARRGCWPSEDRSGKEPPRLLRSVKAILQFPCLISLFNFFLSFFRSLSRLLGRAAAAAFRGSFLRRRIKPKWCSSIWLPPVKPPTFLLPTAFMPAAAPIPVIDVVICFLFRFSHISLSQRCGCSG